MLDNRYEYRDGHFVSQKVSQVVQAIQEYAPEVEVQFIPQGQRKDDTAAYRLVFNPSDGSEPYTIFYVKNDEDFDARVLKRLMMGDQRNGAVTISDIEASEAAAAAVARQRFIDQMEEANEISQAVLRSGKETYKVNDNLWIHQSKPFSRKLRRKYLK